MQEKFRLPQELSPLDYTRIAKEKNSAEKKIKSKFKNVHHVLDGKLYYFADIAMMC